jgi:membrane protease YdiL (CAAX protease family)
VLSTLIHRHAQEWQGAERHRYKTGWPEFRQAFRAFFGRSAKLVADPTYGLQQELRPKNPRWGVWSTLLWMALIGVIYTLAQLVTALGFLAWWPTAYPDQPLVMRDLGSNGPLLGVVTLAATIAVLGMVVLAVRLSHVSMREYLALRWPSWRNLGICLGLTLLLLMASDFVTTQSGHDAIPDFMAGIYESSRDAGVGFFFLLAFTLIVLAPLGEEIVFRGFFYRGLSSGLGPFAAIIITAATWSALHAQYELFFMAQIFAFGIFLGWIRWRSQSLILAMILHAAINALALLQTDLANAI